jgi:hypothetical protein
MRFKLAGKKPISLAEKRAEREAYAIPPGVRTGMLVFLDRKAGTFGFRRTDNLPMDEVRTLALEIAEYADRVVTGSGMESRTELTEARSASIAAAMRTNQALCGRKERTNGGDLDGRGGMHERAQPAAGGDAGIAPAL